MTKTVNPIICPSVLADDVDSYNKQMERISSYAERIHIDVVDGVFAPAKTIDIDQIWWPGGVVADLHVMHTSPFAHVDELVALHPQLIIVHAEAEGDFMAFAEKVHRHGIEVGVALLPDTGIDTIKPALEHIDHVLIFSGKLGHFGGHADLSLLDKAKQIKLLRPAIEIGWDGGVDDKNAAALVEGGIEVLNAGGFLHGAPNPQKAYEILTNLAKKA